MAQNNVRHFVAGKFRREFHRSYFRCLCCCYSADAPDRNGTCFAPIGSSRAGTTRTIVRRNDSCASYRLTHLSPSNHNSINRDYFRNTNTSFIDPMNGPQRQKVRDEAISEPTARFSLTTDVGKDWQLGPKKDRHFPNELRVTDGIETYIARSTNSIDCKPHYDCFKDHSGKCDPLSKMKGIEDRVNVIEERHSDTYDYRDGETEWKELFTVKDDKKNGFKFRFNRSLNSN